MSKTVMIVEDNELNMKLFHDLLEAHGYHPIGTRYAREGLLDPTVPNYPVFNPGYSEANSQQIWGAAEADVIKEGMTPQAAAEKALKRIGQILAKYPIAES